MATPTPTHPVRIAVRVHGVVQGVGFRPFVYNLADRYGVAGFVGNDDDGVFIEAEAPDDTLSAFVAAIETEAPPLARVAGIEVADVAPVGERGFVIVESASHDTGTAFVSPDVATCKACLDDIDDAANRRHRYAFTNCTDCGPRFTITKATPYDRPLTTMAAFTMCEACEREYEDPRNRRFHAQPNACPACGPRVWLETPDGEPIESPDPIQSARDLVASGRVVAIKGVGGFHVAADATNDAAVASLRKRKGRAHKPFAVMVGDVATARMVGEVSATAERSLRSQAAPIVVVPRRADSEVSDLVAPGNATIGIMLPYTPLHRMLVQPGDVWVMTSGNRSQEPIAYANDDARDRIGHFVDAFLMHDRDIHAPVDDSVLTICRDREYPIRRSRGFAPYPIDLPTEVPAMLATGGELKATLCLASGRSAFMSQHIGDMENLETLDAFGRAADHLQELFRIEPEVLVTDMHPRYLSTRWASEVADGRPVVRVQHHHAHVASLMAEHGRTERIIGISFDGTGYGTNATIWGGEVLVADYEHFERVAHLAPVPLVGGDAAVRKPWRMALAELWGNDLPWEPGLAPVAASTDEERTVLLHQLETGFSAVPTTSMGRLFDAVSSLAGVRQVVGYEAQAAIELESLIDADAEGAYRFAIEGDTIDQRPVLRSAVADAMAGVPAGIIAMRFHRAVADAIARVSVQVAGKTGITTVGLTGGVFQNVTLTEMATRLLEDEGMTVMLHERVPPNDGGLALGQVMIGATKVR